MASRKAIKGDVKEFLEDEDKDVSDPFAIDFFSQSKTELDDIDLDDFGAEVDTAFDNQNSEVEIRREWNIDLPHVTAVEISGALIFARLPDDLAKTICEIYTSTISHIVLQNAGQVGCEVLTTIETDFLGEIAQISQKQSVCLSFAVEPQQSVGVLILDSVFAINIIETALNSETLTDGYRELSKIELSVLEFLSLNCFKEINDFFSEPLFRWLTIEQAEPKVALTRGLLSQIRIQIGDNRGIVKLLLPFEFLRNLSESENPLLARSSGGSGNNVRRISQLISSTHLRAILGETIIDAGELTVLEKGDVILVERSLVKFNGLLINGSVQVRVADESEASLYGELVTNNQIQLHVKEINQKDENLLTKFMMPRNQTETLSENEIDTRDKIEDGLALEKIVVNVAVELVSRRISLDEIANIRVGQIIELGSRATDPVELVASGKTIAVGELIDVEGSLGVRLTRILL